MPEKPNHSAQEPETQVDPATAAIDQPEERRQKLFDEARTRFEQAHAKGIRNSDPDEWEDTLYQAQLAWLRLKWGTEGRAPDCPYCGSREWRIGPLVSLSPAGDYALPPFFPVACANCGHTTLISTHYSDLEPETAEGGEK